ncbi:AT-hook motif nuclear-localized protein 1 [Stylosanthes scabra]|uniref:AT-hook motif nuclear-localized protein n=1 Tax=Stylosanthes scabra TaxID=79078 RepID=A0ABU6V8F6_9FABA|nr:AT-hook motif nuclear-localized protein 1 [Stylosanthes scabra]
MESSAGGISAGVTVVGSDAPSEYQIAPRAENPSPAGGSAAPIPTPNPTNQGGAPPHPPPRTAEMTTSPATMQMEKKKRGRPRKYGPDGSVVALSPKPISSSAPLALPPVIDFSAEAKRGKVKPAGTVSRGKFEVENLGEWVACSVGANFTPHFITVNPGEDVTMKVISFSQQGPRAICIMSANGVISSVTLRQPDSSGGTLTYEGRFEILSLSGSFTPSETAGTRSRSGGMSVALSGPDGRVIGGGVAGLLVAASPVQVVVGSFLAGNQHEHKAKKPRHDTIAPTVTLPPVVPVSTAATADPVAILQSQASFRGDSWSAVPADVNKNKPADINVSLPGG